MGHNKKKRQQQKSTSTSRKFEYSEEFTAFDSRWMAFHSTMDHYGSLIANLLRGVSGAVPGKPVKYEELPFDEVMAQYSKSTLVEDLQKVVEAFKQLCGNTGNQSIDAKARNDISKMSSEIMANPKLRCKLFVDWSKDIFDLSSHLSFLQVAIKQVGPVKKNQLLVSYLQDINRGVEILLSRGQLLSVVFKKTLAELGQESYAILISCHIELGKAREAYPLLIKKEFYSKKVDELINKSESCSDKRLVPTISIDDKKWAGQIKKRNKLNGLGELHVAAGNIAGAAECLTIIMNIADKFLSQKKCNHLPVSVINLAANIAKAYEKKGDYARAIKHYYFVRKLSAQVLPPKKVVAFQCDGYFDFDTTLIHDIEDIQETDRLARIQILELTKKYGGLLIDLFAACDIKVELDLFQLTLIFPDEKKMEQFHACISDLISIMLVKPENKIMIVQFAKIHESAFKNLLENYKNGIELIEKEKSSKERLSCPTLNQHYIPTSLKPSRETRRKRQGKGKAEAVAANPTHDQENSDNEVCIAECIIDSSDRILHHLLNDDTGTQYVTVDWSKAEASELGSRITPTIKQKFESHFEQPRIVGKYGSGFKWAKGIWAKQQGIALKLKVGEDIELAAARRVDVTEAGEVRHVYEFDRAINHKSMRK